MKEPRFGLLESPDLLDRATENMKITLHNLTSYFKHKSSPLMSLCSFLLTMTAVICWSMKIRMDPNRAGMMAITLLHTGFPLNGGITQPRDSNVGANLIKQ